MARISTPQISNADPKRPKYPDRAEDGHAHQVVGPEISQAKTGRLHVDVSAGRAPAWPLQDKDNIGKEPDEKGFSRIYSSERQVRRVDRWS
jgi:hypothetical protein